LIASVSREAPLRGVVHAAGVLDDGVVGSLTSERLERVMAPKVAGAWNLHELTRHMDLDAFVLFSSVAATLGGAGQANYAAANAFLDALSIHRHANGLAAVAMAWGPWQRESGMTGELQHAHLARISSSGLLTFSDEQGLELFDAALTTEKALVVLARLDTATLRARARGGELPKVFAGLIRNPGRASKVSGGGLLLARLATVSSAERSSVALEFLRDEVVAVLGHQLSRPLDSDATFKEIGFDSLAAVELRNRLMAATGLVLPATLVFDHPTLGDLAGHLLEEISVGASTPARTDAVDLDKLQLALAGMSAEEARRSGIAARLQSILSDWASSEDAVDEGAADPDLSSATDDEIFELIDRELGAS
jgi:acyl carrier protein